MAATNELNRRGKAVLFDDVRKRLVLDTPEERVRQGIVKVLHEVAGVPYAMMSTEYPLNEVNRSLRTRADIVVWGDTSDGEQRHALLVIEVKAESKFVTDQTFDQALDYADSLGGVPFVGATNSIRLEDLRVYHLPDEGEPRLLDALPSYADMLERSGLIYRPESGEVRLDFAAASAAQRIKELLGVAIGVDTEPVLHPFVAELDNFILCEPFGALPVAAGELLIRQDAGQSNVAYENAGGGGYAGTYRTLVVEEPGVGHQTYRLGVFANRKTKNHPHWGSRKGGSTLLVGTDDPELGPHSALQLRIDDGCEMSESKQRWEVFHDGRMTVGAQGRVRGQVVLDFIRARAPEMVVGSRIRLGSLPAHRPMRWEDGGRDFVLNMVRYAYLRDQLRDQLKR